MLMLMLIPSITVCPFLMFPNSKHAKKKANASKQNTNDSKGINHAPKPPPPPPPSPPQQETPTNKQPTAIHNPSSPPILRQPPTIRTLQPLPHTPYPAPPRLGTTI